MIDHLSDTSDQKRYRCYLEECRKRVSNVKDIACAVRPSLSFHQFSHGQTLSDDFISADEEKRNFIYY